MSDIEPQPAPEQPAGNRLARAARAAQRTTVARHGRQRRRSGWGAAFGAVAGALAVILVAGGGVAAVAAWQLSSNIEQETIAADSIALPPMVGAYEGGFDMLIAGSDTRAGQGGLGGYIESELNDCLLYTSPSPRD